MRAKFHLHITGCCLLLLSSVTGAAFANEPVIPHEKPNSADALAPLKSAPVNPEQNVQIPAASSTKALITRGLSENEATDISSEISPNGSVDSRSGALPARDVTTVVARQADPPTVLPLDPSADKSTDKPRDKSTEKSEDRSRKKQDPPWATLSILGAEIGPNQRRDLSYTAGQSFDGSSIETPVVVIRGIDPGPTLCLTAAVHGDEVNGVEIVRRVLAGIDAEELSGNVIGVPIVNLLGFARGSRYLPDRRDLNRYFPGQPHGSSASRIAHVFFSKVIMQCDLLVDFHTGSFKRTNLPQLRADMSVEAIKDFVGNFGATAVLNKRAASGTLRGAATAAGVPAVAFELGEPLTLQLDKVQFGVKAVDTLLDKLGMIERFTLWSEPQPVFYRSRWLRAYRGGILTSGIRVGVPIRKGDLLGIVTNPINNESTEILSPYNGRLLGRALNQFVLPGFAIFHVGIEARKEEIVNPETDPELLSEILSDEAADRENINDGEEEPLEDDFLDDNETH